MGGPWLVALVAAAVTALALFGLARARWVAGLADRPNDRSLHVVPTPRIGGLGVAAGIFAALPFLPLDGETAGLLVLAAALFGLSLADDVRGLPVALRLAAHLAAALVAVRLALPAMGLAAAVALALAVTWMTNLFNFMDGSDGLAGGMGAFGFGAYAIGAAAFGDLPLACVSATLAGACLGFLAHNFPPARIFLGDSGSIPLGFLAGALGVLGVERNAWPAWFPVLVFSPFAVDATVTLVRRIAAGERPWRAHRSHAYQRLVLAGWTHRRLAVTVYVVMASAAATALAARQTWPLAQWVTIVIWAAIYVVLLIAIERRAPLRPRPAREPVPDPRQE